MGVSVTDFSKYVNNTKGKFKDPSTKKPIMTKGRDCSNCGKEIKSAIVSSILFRGEYCINCIGVMGK